MFSPLSVLSKPNRTKPKRGRRRKPLPSFAPTKHSKPSAVASPPQLFIGPIQPTRLLSLPRPNVSDTTNLRTALLTNTAETIFLDIDNLNMSWQSYYTILPKTWLNDQVIHAYLALLRGRNPKAIYVNLAITEHHFPPTRPTIDYDYIKRLLPAVPITSSDLILIPINIANTHWTLVAIDRIKRSISYYDSLRGDGALYINNAIEYIKTQSETAQQHFDISEWSIDPHAARAFPSQPNGYDCGIYILMVADLLTSNLPVSLLTIKAMSKARTHVGMALWLRDACDLRQHTTFAHVPTLSTPPRATTQTTLHSHSIPSQPSPSPTPTAPPTPEGLPNLLSDNPPVDKSIQVSSTALTSTTVPDATISYDPDTTATKAPDTLSAIVPETSNPPETATSNVSDTSPSTVPETTPPNLVQCLATPSVQTSIMTHFPTTPAPVVPSTRSYGPPRSSRNAGADYGVPQDKKLTKKSLRFLPHIVPEDTSLYEDRSLIPNKAKWTTCSLGIGPSQQYTGGLELYLAQYKCTPGKIITFYNGTQITKEQRQSSTSRYIFEFFPDTNGTPDDTQSIIVDADDPNCGYGRYSDDDLCQGTANAEWRVVGTASNTKLALIAISDITLGQPIRARYGWEYWFQPATIDIRSMRLAFLGYLDSIATSDNHILAMQFATHVGHVEALMIKWNHIPKHLTTDEPSPVSSTPHPSTSPLTLAIKPINIPHLPAQLTSPFLPTPSIPPSTRPGKRPIDSSKTAINKQPALKRKCLARTKKASTPPEKMTPAKRKLQILLQPDEDSDNENFLIPRPLVRTNLPRLPSYLDIYKLKPKPQKDSRPALIASAPQGDNSSVNSCNSNSKKPRLPSENLVDVFFLPMPCPFTIPPVDIGDSAVSTPLNER